jgi:hypothetical protein
MLHKKSLKFLLALLFSTHMFLQAENDKLDKEIPNPLKTKFDLQVNNQKRGQQNQKILFAAAATCVASALATYGITYAFQIYKAQKEIKQQQDKISGLESKSNTQKSAENKEIEELKKQMQKLNEEKDSLTKNVELSETLYKEIEETFLKSDGKETLFNLRKDEKALMLTTILFDRLNNKNSNNKDTNKNLNNKKFNKQNLGEFIDQLIAELKIEKPENAAAHNKQTSTGKDTTDAEKKSSEQTKQAQQQ